MEVNSVKSAPSKARGSIMLKLIVTVMLALFLMIPSTMIMYVVQERQDSRIQAEAEIGQKLGT